MSTVRYCDMGECNNSKYEVPIYSINEEDIEKLKKNYIFDFSKYCNDICLNCINSINEDYEEDYPLLIVNENTFDYGFVHVNKNAKGL